MNRLSWRGVARAAVLAAGMLGIATAVSCRPTQPAHRESAPTSADAPGEESGAMNTPAESDATIASAAKEHRDVFSSPLAGTWYPADRGRLTGEIDGYLAKASGESLSDVCALILPHAGYRYSGQTAAFAVNQLRGSSFDRVIVLGPSHRVPMENVVSVPEFTHYATPLGEVPLDVEFIAKLRRYREIQSVPYAHYGEHSVQIELPLLQRAVGGFRLVPIVVGQLDRPTVRRLGEVLRGLVDAKTLVVASSDFTHYGPNFSFVPFSDDVPEQLKKLDMGAVEQIGKRSVDGFFDYVQRTGATICGRYGIGVLLSMLPDDARMHLLRYDTSGGLTGDYTNSVSYCALAFTGKWPQAEAAAPPARADELSEKDKAALLRLARATLSYAVKNQRAPAVADLGVEITPAMKRISGAFVTLHAHGQLRGCIGEIFPSRPLYRAVMAQAINAGLNDHRFQPVQAAELDDIDFEISVLTPPRPIAGADDIVVGRHGVVLRKSGQSAVFLPQVATEQHWDRDTMLSRLSRKAGLPPDAWRQGASFEVFEAIVFGEKENSRT